MTTDQHEFTIHISAHQDDIDHNNHVNNVSYLRWAQQASMAHWDAQVSHDNNPDIKWVIVRHEVDYKSPAFLGESITAKTRWGNASRLRFERLTEFFRTHDHKLLAKVRSLLCPVHPETNKPIVMDENLRAMLGVRHGEIARAEIL